MSGKVYWTMKNGQKIDVDKMDINHLRNTLKMIIRNVEAKPVKKQRSFQLNGDIAQMHNDLMLDKLYVRNGYIDYDLEEDMRRNPWAWL